MTTRYCCDHCGASMTYEDEKIVCVQVGASSDQSFENNKLADICPACWHEVVEFIRNRDKPKIDFRLLDDAEAINNLKKQGYVVYKKHK